MQFKEFLLKSEAIENESILSMAKGGWNTFAGGMTVADELLAKTMGDGTKGRMRGGFGQLGRGLRQIAIGDPPKQPQAPEVQMPQQQPKQQAQRQPAKQIQKPQTSPVPFLKELERTEKAKERAKQQPEAWVRLVQMYKVAKTAEERREIRRRMELVSPNLYQKAVEAGKNKAK
jgi:hypothetical protein